MQAENQLPEDLTLDNILANFATDEQARKYLETWLWPNGPTCPRCKSNDPARVYAMKAASVRPGLFNCKGCRRQFTVTVGTIFEDSHIPLRKWLVAWYLLCSSKKGMSSLQMQRILGLGSYKTALFMTHRIRHALRDQSFSQKLSGDIEVDETYVGGRTTGGKTGRGTGKTPVVALVQRNGDARSMVMNRVTGKNLKQAIRDNVLVCSNVHTDDFASYTGLGPKFEHRTVKHSIKEYARREKDTVVHTNTVECFFSLLKRGVIGTFHQVSKQHLPLYLAEFDHRWNHRKVSDGERTVAGIVKARGKRLTYRAIKGR
ncbi:MAG: IS1595 family transposase [Chthoniobacteraceae bacterium]|jgi:transposase-like protein